MQAIIELALKSPLKLRMIQIPGMQFEVISMHGHGPILELNDDLDRLAFGTGGEIQQRMFVELQLRPNTVQAGLTGFTHEEIVVESVFDPCCKVIRILCLTD